MKVLLVEDDEVKGAEVVSFLEDEYPETSVTWTKSFDGALRELIGDKRADIMILDMSLPTHEMAAGDLSGAENFAGRDLLQQMKFRKLVMPTIVVTMFDRFGKGASMVSVEEIRDKMASDFPSNFVGLVYYSLAEVGWRSSLKKYIDKVNGVD
ncbi:response regulator transcription factor [Xanthomonas arboricola]|uniref:response regulator transcription factor n=1 Tax=Xanthomonas arboricola TaxID=56448 RepID=UPI000E1ECB8D|nr:response regulator transcription factor [Xanthomonas arboricola]